MRDLGVNRGGGAHKRRHASAPEAEFDRLGTLDGAGLLAAWEARFGSTPPAVLPARILRLALAYEVQAREFGGLSPATERRLTRIAQGAEAAATTKRPSLRLKPGTTLLRDWGGRTWRVEIEGDGSFRFAGKHWRSLSAIARQITGTNRNGPAFFGLRAGGNDGAV